MPKELWQPEKTITRSTPFGAFTMTTGNSTIPGKDAPLLVKLRWVLEAKVQGSNTVDGIYRKISTHIGTGDLSYLETITKLQRLLRRYCIKGAREQWHLKPPR